MKSHPITADGALARSFSVRIALPRALPNDLNLSTVGILAFRWFVVGCQAATLLITWPLWAVHSSPPMLPALPLPQFGMGVLLLVSLSLILVRPVPGTAVHTILIIYAMLIDQTRMQPEVVSLVFLLWATLAYPTAKAFGRAHLVSLWCFAGIHKLFSPGFMHGTAQWILSGLVSSPSPWLQANIGYVIAGSELAVGTLALIPRARKFAALGAFCLHVGIVINLSPIGHDWNKAVWPWNLALAVAGFALIAPWKASPMRTLLGCHRFARPLAVLLVIAPAGFYIGLTDAYLAHNLYSSNTATASMTTLSPGVTWGAFNVPLPPEHRLFKEFFQRTCRPGDTMIIVDTRWWYRHRGLEREQFSCPSP